MYPCLLFSKKRYVNRYWEEKFDKEKNIKYIADKGIDAKGIQLVRRDNCKYVKIISNPILKKIMYEKDIPGAENIARKMIKDLLNGKVSIDNLVITKSLKSVYPDFNINGRKITKPAHWFLSQKMKERDPNDYPKAGDRVPYIFIENKDRNALQSDRVEDPEYAKKNDIKPDVLYYLDKQIISPLETLFSVLVKDKNGEIFPVKYNNKGEMKITKECKQEIGRRLYHNAKRRKENQLKGQMEITSWFTKK